MKEIIDAIGSGERIAVKFWANWCVPCKVAGPQYITATKEANVPLYEVNVDDHQDFTTEHNVSSLPTLLIFAGGKEVGRKTGMAGGIAAIRALLAQG